MTAAQKNFPVGKKASYNGFTMIARTDDSGHFIPKKIVTIHPARDGQPETADTLDKVFFELSGQMKNFFSGSDF